MYSPTNVVNNELVVTSAWDISTNGWVLPTSRRTQGFAAGIAIDRFGQKIVAAVGVCLIAFGWFGLRGAVTGGWPESAVGMALLTIGTGGVSTLMSMLTWQQAQYASAHRGKITALLLASYCLAGAFWAPIYENNYAISGNLADYCSLVGGVALSVGVLVVAVTGDWTACGSRAPVATPSANAVGSATAPTTENAVPSDTAGSGPSMAPQAIAIPWEKRGTGDDDVGLPSETFGQDDGLADGGRPHLSAASTPMASPGAVTKEAASEPSHAVAVANSPAAGGDAVPESRPPTVLTVLLCISRYAVFFWLLYAPVFVILGSAFVCVNCLGLMVDSLRGIHDISGAPVDPAIQAAADGLIQQGVCRKRS